MDQSVLSVGTRSTGTQDDNTSLPPGFNVRYSSDKPCDRWVKKITPNSENATSKDSLESAKRCPSPTLAVRFVSFSSSTWCTNNSIMAGEKSTAVTWAPWRAASKAKVPGPQARSSTRVPGRTASIAIVCDDT